MFKVIRLPTKFSRTIKRFSQKEKSELLGMLISIWDWDSVILPDNIVWDTVSLIYGEWMNMESKNGNKPEESLIQYGSELVGQVAPSNSDSRVEYNRVEENRIEERRIVATKVATLKELMTKNINDKEFIDKWVPEDLLIKEKNKFYLYRIQKNEWWKKEHWQKQKTFDVKLRFITRLWKVNNFNNNKKQWIVTIE